MKTEKIYVLGAPGSGKSYLANKLSSLLKIPHYDMDDVRFIKKFTKIRTKEKRKQKVDKIHKNKKWIIDARGTGWDRHSMLKADTIIWIKTPPHKRTLRILKRYLKRKNDSNLEEKFSDQFPLIKYSLSYEFGKKLSSLKPTKEFLKKHNLNPIILKNNKEINDFIKKLK
mgnify:FL=1|tara:strand:+ start:787 stop:1296 length:510 start_codon:yes stop_codon:yes gene_type:complete